MKFSKLPKLKPDDKVAILSPSSDAASYFPWVLDRGINQLKEEFLLVPVEYPSTRQRGASPSARASDVMAAFENKEIKAIFSTIGGDDQIKLLPYLDAGIIKKNIKPFVGYSDNTNISHYLWNLGIPSYYGGAIMVQFAMPGNGMFPSTSGSIHHALFSEGAYDVAPSSHFTDIELDWADEASLGKSRTLELNEGWHWDGSGLAEGILWGGCVETILKLLASGMPTPKPKDNNLILFLETAENIPDHWIVESLLTALGERGLLSKASGVLIGRPKAWDFSKQLSQDQRDQYRRDQRDTVIRTVRSYRKNIPIVQNLDFGHTDPQIIVPSGNTAVIDSMAETIKFYY